MTTTLDTIATTFAADARVCSTEAFPVHVVPVPPAAWANDDLPRQDLLFGWTPPTPTTPEGAIIRYCPDLLAYAMAAMPDEVVDNVLVPTISQLNRCVIDELAVDADAGVTRDRLDLYAAAEDQADAVLGVIPDDPDETSFVDFLTQFRVMILESA